MQDAEIEMLSAYIAAIECVRRVIHQTQPDSNLAQKLKEADVALNTAIAEEMHNLTLDYGAHAETSADIFAIPSAEPILTETESQLEPLTHNTSAQPTPGDLPADEIVAEPPKAGL